MPYITRTQVEDKILPPILRDALDDDGDGLEDSGRFDSLVATASQEVDGYLAGLFTVPFADPAPPKVCQAALCFMLEAIYARRSVGVNTSGGNPYATQANFWRAHLQKVGNRELPFDAGQAKAFSPGAALVETLKVNAQGT